MATLGKYVMGLLAVGSVLNSITAYSDPSDRQNQLTAVVSQAQSLPETASQEEAVAALGSMITKLEKNLPLDSSEKRLVAEFATSVYGDPAYFEQRNIDAVALVKEAKAIETYVELNDFYARVLDEVYGDRLTDEQQKTLRETMQSVALGAQQDENLRDEGRVILPIQAALFLLAGMHAANVSNDTAPGNPLKMLPRIQRRNQKPAPSAVAPENTSQE